MDGYYYDTSAKSVKQCQKGCQRCIEKMGAPGTPTCYECMDDYALASSGGINKCVNTKRNSKTRTGIIVGVIIGCILLVLVIVAIVLLIRLHKKMDWEDSLREQGDMLIPGGQYVEEP